jgi:malate dehydrogenase (oxaloacetate-decarboxylating)
MKMAASYAIASCVPESELNADNILPNAFDRSVANAVAEAVAEAAIKSGVAKLK